MKAPTHWTKSPQVSNWGLVYLDKPGDYVVVGIGQRGLATVERSAKRRCMLYGFDVDVHEAAAPGMAVITRLPTADELALQEIMA